MGEYEAYWLMDFPLINSWMSQEVLISQKQLTNKYKKKLIILHFAGIIAKNKETRVVTYTCRYSSGNLIPIIRSCQDRIKKFASKTEIHNHLELTN